jgi:hypothetical protein
MTAIANYTAGTGTGATIALAANNYREEVAITVTGGDVWIGYNEEAKTTQGNKLVDGSFLVLTGQRAKSDLYFITSTGTATIGMDVQGG